MLGGRVPVHIYKRAALQAGHGCGSQTLGTGWISPPLFPLDGHLGTGQGLLPAPTPALRCGGVDYLCCWVLLSSEGQRAGGKRVTKHSWVH